MAALSLDSGVSLFEPAVPPAAPVRSPTVVRTATATGPRTEPAPSLGQLDRPDRGRHGRRAEQPAPLRGRRASTTSTTSPAVLARTARLVAVRVLGTSAAAAAVTWALAAKGAAETPELAALSIRGLAAAAIICAAWGFQDRPRLGALTTTRAWFATALVLALAHAVWFATTLPGAASSRLGITAAAFAFDAVLVAVPALLGARAGRPEVRPAI